MPPVGFKFRYMTAHNGEKTTRYSIPGLKTGKLETGDTVRIPNHPSHVRKIGSVATISGKRRNRFTVLIQPGSLDSIEPDSQPEEMVTVGEGESYDIRHFYPGYGPVGTLTLEQIPDKRRSLRDRFKGLLKSLDTN